MELLNEIKALFHSTTEVRHKHWSLTTSPLGTVNIRQGDDKPMATHCERFKKVIHIGEINQRRQWMWQEERDSAEVSEQILGTSIHTQQSKSQVPQKVHC